MESRTEMKEEGAFKQLFGGFTLQGTVAGVEERSEGQNGSIKMRTRKEDTPVVLLTDLTAFAVLTNIDGLQRSPKGLKETSLKAGQQLIVQGVSYTNGKTTVLQATNVTLLHTNPKLFVFEEPDWWITQISRLSDTWLDAVFGNTRDYSVEDFAAKYRTVLSMTVSPVDDDRQECATLGRLIYGLSSAFILTGNMRYLQAAAAGVEFQRQSFRCVSSDGQHILWYSRRDPQRGLPESVRLYMASDNKDDQGWIPLYEQIYSLAGLAQFFRATQDPRVLHDIRRTVAAFQKYFHDSEENKQKRNYPGFGGYFSHIDPVTFRPDAEMDGLFEQDKMAKNWNSIGDHIPAYLINVIVALDPLPTADATIAGTMRAFQQTCRQILEETTQLIVDKFTQPPDSKETPYVQERFKADWTPIKDFDWQRDRAVIGHNLKIVWNLTRAAFFFEKEATEARNADRADDLVPLAKRCHEAAQRLAEDMNKYGAVDAIRGGLFDVVERHPKNDMSLQFAWRATKDFWQQEQGILAYLIRVGANCGSDEKRKEKREQCLRLARDTSAFWNAFFLDRVAESFFFRTNADGQPVVLGQYRQKGSHAVSGYHAFELCFLAHVYTRAHVAPSERLPAKFSQNFHVDVGDGSLFRAINVLPDFMPTDRLRVVSVQANGVDISATHRPNNGFQVSLENLPFMGKCLITVEMEASLKRTPMCLPVFS